MGSGCAGRNFADLYWRCGLRDGHAVDRYWEDVMDKARFIEQFTTQFLATWAAEQYRLHGAESDDWLKNPPLEVAQISAR